MSASAAGPLIELTNGTLSLVVRPPDVSRGFYHGTRFDWAGMIERLRYAGHTFYQPWFSRTDPVVDDFAREGDEIVAGPNSAASGPAEEFLTGGQGLGYEDAGIGDTFVKIGVGSLRRPDGGPYSRFARYEIAEHGVRELRQDGATVEFVHELHDTASGYSYRYEKALRLAPDGPRLTLDHRLENLGRRPIETSVYNHNFLVLDGETTGPAFDIETGYDPVPLVSSNSTLATVQGRRVTFTRAFRRDDVVSMPLLGFGPASAHHRFTIRNHAVRAGVTLTADRALSHAALWAIRQVICVEPFVSMRIEPGRDFTWCLSYEYFVF